jgi:hypothetical protein
MSQTQVVACGATSLWQENISNLKWVELDFEICHMYRVTETELAVLNSKGKGHLLYRHCTGRTAHRGSRGIVLLFHPWERLGTHCTGGWVGPRASLDRCEKSRSPPGCDPRTFQPIATRYTDWATWPTVLNRWSWKIRNPNVGLYKVLRFYCYLCCYLLPQCSVSFNWSCLLWIMF